jgi:hypothetical protein
MNPTGTMPQFNFTVFELEPTTAKNDPTNDARRCACNKCGCTKTMDKSGEIVINVWGAVIEQGTLTWRGMARTLRLKLEGEYYRWSKFHVEDWRIRVPGEWGGG